MGALNKLSARFVDAVKAPGVYGDGGNLYLQVQALQRKGGKKSIAKSWLFRFMREGRAREMGLGALHTIALADARQRAAECRRQLLDGLDPIAERDRRRLEARAAAAKLKTFQQCADEWLADNKGTWKNAKHRQQWVNTLDTYVHPIIGHLPVTDVNTDMIVRVLRPIWTKIPETARRVRMRIERVLAYATAIEARSGPNPARWKSHLDNILPSNRGDEEHQPALPYDQLSEFMAALRLKDGASAKALEFAILTCMRTSEVIQATWAEIDLKARAWNLSAERMKADRGHSVPLPDRAVEILQSLDRTGEFVFGNGKSLSNQALLELLRGMQEAQPGRWIDPEQDNRPAVPHGFRSTFSTWARERTAYARDVVEMALAHAVKDKTEAAYFRGDLFEKRRRLMGDWATFASTPAAPTADNVVAMQAGAVS
jgi:integrase